MNGPSEPDNSARPGFSLRRFIVRRLRFLAVAMPVCCLALLLPVEGWLFELLRHFRLWNAVIGIGLAVLLVLFRDWKYAAIALLAGLWQGWPVWDYSRELPRKDRVSNPGEAFTLLTCNLLYECREPERMIASLREANPDVLLLLEFTPEWQGKFKETMWKDFPHRLEDPHAGPSGICLASKFPLENAAVLDVLDSFPVVRATFNAGGQRITMLGVHPVPPIRPEMYQLWRDSIAEWPTLLQDGRDGHHIIAGDLNSAPFTRTFARLCEDTGLRDSAPGFGLTNTWHLAGPLGLPLDHVLVSWELVVSERTIGPDTGSDHRWVKVKLVPTGQAAARREK